MGRILIRKTPDGEPKSNNKERVSHREVRKREWRGKNSKG
jgi:hypothetical protein